MQIAFVLSQSLDSPSGLGRYGPLARELARAGHSVDVVALHYAWQQLPGKTFTESGVRVSYVGQMHVRKAGSTKSYYGPIGLLAVSLASTLRLARAVAQSDAEIIQLCKPQPINALAVKLGGRGRRIYCDCDDYEAATNRFSAEWQRRVVRYFEDDVVRYATGLTVNTQFTLQRYGALGFPVSRIRYVPNGVERARFMRQSDLARLRQQLQIGESEPVIAYVGTLGLLSHPVDLLLEAFQKMMGQMPQARLLLVGGGEDYDRVQQMACQLGIRERTILAGRVLPEEVPDYWRLAAVSVDPVRDDLIAKARSPLKVLESLVAGVPVVTSDVGDRRVLLRNGELGLLVAAGDSEALADGLLALLRDTARRARMSEAALEYRETCYWDKLTDDFAQVYEINPC